MNCKCGRMWEPWISEDMKPAGGNRYCNIGKRKVIVGYRMEKPGRYYAYVWEYIGTGRKTRVRQHALSPRLVKGATAGRNDAMRLLRKVCGRVDLVTVPGSREGSAFWPSEARGHDARLDQHPRRRRA